MNNVHVIIISLLDHSHLSISPKCSCYLSVTKFADWLYVANTRLIFHRDLLKLFYILQQVHFLTLSCINRSICLTIRAYWNTLAVVRERGSYRSTCCCNINYHIITVRKLQTLQNLSNKVYSKLFNDVRENGKNSCITKP